MRHVFALIAALFVFPAFAGGQYWPVSKPFTFAVTAENSVKVEHAFHRALGARLWTITKEAPQSIEATYNARGHSVTIAATWDAKMVDIKYVGSENMNYKVEDGIPYVGSKYWGWLKLLRYDTTEFLKQDASK